MTKQIHGEQRITVGGALFPRLSLCLFASVLAASAAPTTFSLQGVTFSDGNTASGTFTFDPATNLYTNVNINFTAPPGFTFNTASYLAIPANPTFVQFLTTTGDNTGLPTLVMFFTPGLPAASSLVASAWGLCTNPACTATGAALGSVTAGTVQPVVGFQVSYAANLAAGDSFVNITNAGSAGAGLQSGTTATITGALCANVYAFTPDEQLVSCCSCPVTPDGLVSLSAKNDLASNTLTPAVPSALVIKVLTTLPTTAGGTAGGVGCNNSAAAVGTASLADGLKSYGTTIHATPTAGTYGVTERPFSVSTLSAGELNRLGTLCNFIIANGSGYGQCRSCRLGGLGTERQ